MAPEDAMVQVLDGEAMVNVDGKKMTVGTGQVVVMRPMFPMLLPLSSGLK